jgi:hypothetical protein
MTHKRKPSEEAHKKFAVGLFNSTWNLLDKKDRTKAEDDKMIHSAHASRFHWGEIMHACKENNIGDFDIAFAYEGMARAYVITGNKTECEKYINLAKEAGEQIKKKEDRNYFFSEFKTIEC